MWWTARGTHTWWGVVAALACAHFAIARDSQGVRSPTYDEPNHLAAGLAIKQLSDYRVNTEHPPLAFRLAVIPVTRQPLPTQTEDWQRLIPARLGGLTIAQIQASGGDPHAVMTRARIVPGLWAAGLVVLVAVWARAWHGAAAGLLAAALAAFLPSLLAHGPLLTTDVPAAVTCSLALLAGARALAAPSAKTCALAGLALGLALGTKFSALFLGPTFLCLVAWRAWQCEPAAHGWGSPVPAALRGTGPWARLGTGACVVAALGLVAWLVLWAVYGFQASAGPADDGRLAFGDAAVAGVTGWILRTCASAHVLPEAFCFGLGHMLWKAERVAFLFGRPYAGGVWYWFPVAFAVKATLAWLACLAASAGLHRRLRCGDGREAPAWLWIAVYGAVAMASGFNIGERHLWPIYPALLVAASRVAKLASGRLGCAALVGVAVGHAADALRVHPYHLTYFNACAGGPANGRHVLLDSNLDWGQDLPTLRDFLRREGIETIAFEYFGSVEPRVYGIRSVPIFSTDAEGRAILTPAEVRVMSATSLGFAGFRQRPDAVAALAPLLAREPDVVLGGSLLVYDDRFPRRGEPGGRGNR